MRNLLIGNGIDIQYGGADYLNKNIIKRVIDNLTIQKREDGIYHPVVLHLLFNAWNKIDLYFEGKFDIKSKIEMDTLSTMKNKYYKKKITGLDIGMEDYLLLIELYLIKKCDEIIKLFPLDEDSDFKLNKEQYIYIYLSFVRIAFLDSIFNNGVINNIKFPTNLSNYFSQFNNIFTTNYDNNIENFTNKTVYYLHGAFHIKSSDYIEGSIVYNIANEIEVHNNEFKKHIIKNPHLYSTALMSYNGKVKRYLMNQNDYFNKELLSFKNYINNKCNQFKNVFSSKEFKEYSKEKMIEEGNLSGLLFSELVSKPYQTFPLEYPLFKFEQISGSIDIVGLSPNNDNHLFDMINDSLVEIVNFYYFDEVEVDEIKKVLNKKKINIYSVKDLWNKYK